MIHQNSYLCTMVFQDIKSNTELLLRSVEMLLKCLNVHICLCSVKIAMYYSTLSYFY